MFKNKNILFLKKKRYSSYYDNIVKGIVEFGKPNKVYFVEYDSNSNFVDINKKLDSIIFKNNISIFISLSYYLIDPFILVKYRKKVFRVRIDGDDGVIFNHYSKWYAQLFDLNITTNSTAHEKFKSLNFNSILYANNLFYKKIKKNILNKKYQYEISFIGLTNSKSRKEYLDSINENNFNLSIFGEKTLNGKLNIEDKYLTYMNTKINLNFSKVFNFDKSLLIYEPNLYNNTTMQGRIFEVLSVGGFLLTEYSPSIEYFFKPDKDLVMFRNKNEMIQKINYYLNNEVERKMIARNGRIKFNKYYEYSVYTPKFIKQIKYFSNKKNDTENYEWPNILKSFISRFIRIKYMYKPIYIYYIFKYCSFYFYFRNKIKNYR
ncbi:glycosyltransferase [Pelagibacteraceae bacterium]|nr:glycosyltransferase [Pelagibacteraceae bacterium]